MLQMFYDYLTYFLKYQLDSDMEFAYICRLVIYNKYLIVNTVD